MKKILISVLTVLVLAALAREAVAGETAGSNPRAARRFGFGIQAGGPTFILSLQADYFLTPRVNVEVGAGLLGLYGALKVHLGGGSWSPYLGASVALIPEIRLFGSGGGQTPSLYFPAGIQYMSRRGFTLAVELAAYQCETVDVQTRPFWGALKFGYHF